MSDIRAAIFDAYAAAARHGVTGAALLAEVPNAYRNLDADPDVPVVPRQVRDRGLGTAILSNGEPGMLAEATRAAGIEALLDFVLSIEAAGVFQPNRRVYRLAADRLDLASEQIAFVSSNAWDAFGFRACWLDRVGDPPEYDLRGAVPELSDLTALPQALP